MTKSDDDKNDDDDSSSSASSSSYDSSSSASTTNTCGIDQNIEPNERIPSVLLSSSSPTSLLPTTEQETSNILTIHSNHHHHLAQRLIDDESNPIMTAASCAATTSMDQERQILLLMLLAQVCALHDVTPKTFTVHVLELYERGILDPSSIHFLYDLGLVSQPILTDPGIDCKEVPPTPQQQQQLLLMTEEDRNQPEVVDAAMVISPTSSSHPKHQQHDVLYQRSMETSAIRMSLEYHHLQSQPPPPTQLGSSDQSKEQLCHSSSSSSSWTVDAHPLSLSRYQREFNEIGRLASGSFGDVYRAINYMDGCEYAMKHVSFHARGYSNASIQQVIREVHCLAVCDHPNVVRYYTSWLEPSWMTGNNCTVSNRHITNADSTGTDDEYIQLITEIRSVISSGNSIDHMTENLESYFRDASLRSRRRHSISGRSLDDDNRNVADYARDCNDACMNGLLNETRDDISVDGYRARRQRKLNNNCADSRTEASTLPYSTPLYQYQISLYIQMQLCDSTTLADWIRTRNEQLQGNQSSIEERIGLAIDIFEQIVNGLHHVHSSNIVHRDLKPSNVFAAFVASTNSTTDDTILHFKIGDFGLSKLIPTTISHLNYNTTQRQRRLLQVDTSARMDTLSLLPEEKIKLDQKWSHHHTAGVGTASYAAPEQVVTETYGTAVDIFSLGLILLELVCCFSTEHERLQTFHNCRHQRVVPTEIQDTHPSLAQVILNCTELNPMKRPTASDLILLDLRHHRKDRLLDTTQSMTRSNNCATDHESLVISLRKNVMDKDQQLAEMKLQLEQYQLELKDKDKIIEELLQQQSSYQK